MIILINYLNYIKERKTCGKYKNINIYAWLAPKWLHRLIHDLIQGLPCSRFALTCWYALRNKIKQIKGTMSFSLCSSIRREMHHIYPSTGDTQYTLMTINRCRIAIVALMYSFLKLTCNMVCRDCLNVFIPKTMACYNCPSVNRP